MSTDTHKFEVVYKGSWYWLGSLKDHVREKVPAGASLLFDRTYRSTLVPQSEVHIPLQPINWPKYRERRPEQS